MAESSEKKKRKREAEGSSTSDEPARITYHTPFKTFERLFNEVSLDDTKRVVRAKLGLEPHVELELAQIRGQSRIVLEDEDDFRAFRVALKANSQVEVQVTVAGSTAAQAQEADIAAPAKKKRKTKQSNGPDPSTSATFSTTSSLASHTGGGPPDTSVTSIASSSKSMSPTTTPFNVNALGALPFPMGITPVPVRTLPPAAGVFGAAGGGEDVRKEKDKEKPKRVRKKSEPAVVTVMSPAARERAAAILERHRQAVADRAKPRKREKYGSGVKGAEPVVPVASKPAKEGAPTAGEDRDADAQENKEKPKKEKKKKKKRKDTVADDAEQTDEEQERIDSPEKDAEEDSPKEQKKDRKRKKDKRKDGTDGAHRTPAVVDDEQPVPARESSPAGEEGSRPENNTEKMDVNVNSRKPKSKLVPGITKHKDPSTTKGEKSTAANATAAKAKSPTSPALPSDGEVSSILAPRHASDPVIAKAPPGKPSHPSPLCPLCLKPFHLRFKCELLQQRGLALEKRLEELRVGGGPSIRKGKGKEPPNPALVKDIEQWLETERKREVLRLTRPGDRSRKRRWTTPESEDMEDEEEVASEVLGDLEKAEEEEEDDDDDDDDDDEVASVPESLGMPTTSKNSLVSVQKPGEGSEATSSDDEEEDPPAIEENVPEDEDMKDASRDVTPQAHAANLKATNNHAEGANHSSTESSTSRVDSPSPAQRPTVRSQRPTSGRSNGFVKPPLTARSPRSFRGIDGEPSDGADDAIHEHMERETAHVLVRNSDDSEDDKMMDGNDDDYDAHTLSAARSPNHEPMDEERLDALFPNRGSPVAKGRVPGTPSRIQVMKDRHGNTAPVLRTYDAMNGWDDEHSSSPGPRPRQFPDHKSQSASQPTSGSRFDLIPRLSNLASIMFKGTPKVPSSPGLPTPIAIPGSGKVALGAAAEISEEGSSSSSSDSDAEDERGSSRIPKMQRAGSSLRMPPKKSVLAQF